MRTYRWTSVQVGVLYSLLLTFGSFRTAAAQTGDVHIGSSGYASEATDGTIPSAIPLDSSLMAASMWKPISAIRTPVVAQTRHEHDSTARKLWITSVIALAASSAIDAHSSWGKQEMNNMLAGSQGHFGTRGAVLKASINAGWVISQLLCLRKTHAYRGFTVANFVAASLFGATSVHNYGVSAPSQR